MSDSKPQTPAAEEAETHEEDAEGEEPRAENEGDAQEKEKSRAPSANEAGSQRAKSHISGGTPGPGAGEDFDVDDMPDEIAIEDAAADARNLRRIIAEDPEWNLSTVPLLSDLCLGGIVENFEYNSDVINKLGSAEKAKVLKKVPVGVSKKITAHLILDENYWKKVCKERWQVCDVFQYGNSWKRMYFERELQQIIEYFVPETTDPTQLNETLELAGPYVKRLQINQLLPPIKDEPKEDSFSDIGSDAGDEPEIDHFAFGSVLPQLPNLVELRLCYTVKDCGMNFEWNLFQFTARDCLLLAKAVAACTQLKVFQLSHSKVDCDKCRVLISQMLDHPSLEALDFSHNSIGDRGARALGKFINGHSKLTKMNVCDNQIRALGAQAIAHALIKNTTLRSLNLRMNRLADDGGQAICKALLKNATLEDLNLSSNELSEPTATILAQVVSHNKVISNLDISNNRLGADGGKQLQEGMEDNSTVLDMDLRFTECGQESEYRISQILERNQERREKRMNK